MINLIAGDNLAVLKTLPDNSIDAVVTDPPYSLKFMNKHWDTEVPSVEFWKEVYRVLKPGAHVLSFGGTRTYHRMVVNIEDAGFEIRDQLAWIYGSGFPKSHNISKGIDKKFGAETEIIYQKEKMNIKGSGENSRLMNSAGKVETLLYSYTAPNTDLAKEWDGWGTALKPAQECICLARKPLSEKTVVDNVLKWGTGALNIDACRIPFQSKKDFENQNRPNSIGKKFENKQHDEAFLKDFNSNMLCMKQNNPEGRWPSNILLDEQAAEILDEQSGQSTSVKTRNSDNRVAEKSGTSLQLGKAGTHDPQNSYCDSGGASRFFYCSKASQSERNRGLEDQRNVHPTVKPIKLLKYLITLVTPPGGTVLDPFLGSGSTAVACKELGVSCIGIEIEQEYLNIAKARVG